MNIPLCAGRVPNYDIEVAISTKLCASSNKSRTNIAADMNSNIKDVFVLIKQPISEGISAYIQSKNSVFFGSSTMIIKTNPFDFNFTLTHNRSPSM